MAIIPNNLLFQCHFPVVLSRYCAFFDRNLALSVAFCIMSVSVALALAINRHQPASTGITGLSRGHGANGSISFFSLHSLFPDGFLSVTHCFSPFRTMQRFP